MKINSTFLRWLFCAAVMGVMVFIFYFSSQTADVSINTSDGFLKMLFSLFVKDYDKLDAAMQNGMIMPFIHFIRKAAHFIIYAALGFFACMYAFTFNGKIFYRAVFSSLGCLLYAVSDEIHQLYVVGRSGQVSDVFLDYCGVWFGIAFAVIILLVVFKVKQNFGGTNNA